MVLESSSTRHRIRVVLFPAIPTYSSHDQEDDYESCKAIESEKREHEQENRKDKKSNSQVS
ncbi:MAG: hypothetical protein WAW59_05665 [Patescibacteria group bacterium]